MLNKELEINLKFFVSGLVPHNFIATVKAWNTQVRSWLELSLAQQNPLECNEELLELIAWERRLIRLPDEPLEIYRKRINFAFVNERDAGSAIGLKRIFERLGVGFVSIEERSPLREWDVVSLNVDDDRLSTNSELLAELIRLYGRTCRRYEFTTTTKTDLQISANSFSGDSATYKAKASI